MTEELIFLISQILKVPESSINSNSTAADVEEWDSMSHLNLIFAIEQKYGVRFSDEQVIDSMSIDKITQIILTSS